MLELNGLSYPISRYSTTEECPSELVLFTHLLVFLC